MKTARITFLSTPEFKTGLEKLARKDEISVGELVRRKFSLVPSAEERELAELASAVKINAAAAKASLTAGLADVEQALREVRSARRKIAAAKPRSVKAVASRPARKKAA